MNLLNLDEKNRELFSKTVHSLIQKHKLPAQDIFLNVLESEEAPEMNYWMTKVLIQEHFVSAQKELGKDENGETVKPIHAACLLRNVGMLAALLEMNAYSGGLHEKDFQLVARIASKYKDEALLSLMMRYAQELGSLEVFMKALQNAPTQ